MRTIISKFASKSVLAAAVAVFALAAGPAHAATPVNFLGMKLSPNKAAPASAQTLLTSALQTEFGNEGYREIRAQPIFDAAGKPDHLLVYLLSKKYHRVDFAAVALSETFAAGYVQRNYKLTAADHAQQPGAANKELAHCPDTTVQFIAFAPNDDELEQQVTVDVADASEAKGLKTIRLLKADATREAYLNYMACPNLRGNFYDGDADPSAITTVDGVISSDEIKSMLKDKFALKVTNIWLACEAFNEPMKPAVIEDAKARKYAAGINDLLVGPSDKAAACAMKAAMDHQPMKAAFDDCYSRLDDPEDQWGFDGNGTDNFWD